MNVRKMTTTKEEKNESKKERKKEREKERKKASKKRNDKWGRRKREKTKKKHKEKSFLRTEKLSTKNLVKIVFNVFVLRLFSPLLQLFARTKKEKGDLALSCLFSLYLTFFFFLPFFLFELYTYKTFFSLAFCPLDLLSTFSWPRYLDVSTIKYVCGTRKKLARSRFGHWCKSMFFLYCIS